MQSFIKLPQKFLSKHFAETSSKTVDNSILKTPVNYSICPRSVSYYKKVYENFDNMFSIFLSKFSDSYPIKKVVKIPFDAKIIYFGASVSQTKENIFVRCAIDEENRLFGIILDINYFGINPLTGETLNIDNCIYATYYGMIRAAVITQETKIKNDEQLNQKLSNYLYLLMLKIIGAKQFLSREKRTILQLASIFFYYKHYYGAKDSAVYNILQKQYDKMINSDVIKAFYTKYKNVLGKYNYIRQLPHFLFDIGILKNHPNKVLLDMLKLYGITAFTSIMYSLDTLAALCIVCKYSSSDIFSSACVVSSKLQSSIEEDCLKLINKIKIYTSKFTKK